VRGIVGGGGGREQELILTKAGEGERRKRERAGLRSTQWEYRSHGVICVRDNVTALRCPPPRDVLPSGRRVGGVARQKTRPSCAYDRREIGDTRSIAFRLSRLSAIAIPYVKSRT